MTCLIWRQHRGQALWTIITVTALCGLMAVRVRESFRSRGLGAAMMGWAIDEARRRGCGLVQLTTDKARPDAHRFYERLGFMASHQGMKLRL
jgi:GNAT superfamily N-acetyltransferase